MHLLKATDSLQSHRGCVVTPLTRTEKRNNLQTRTSRIALYLILVGPHVELRLTVVDPQGLKRCRASNDRGHGGELPVEHDIAQHLVEAVRMVDGALDCNTRVLRL